MILLASDYVGYCITKFLCAKKEHIDVFFYDSADRGGYNKEIITLIQNTSTTTKVYEKEALRDKALLSDLRIQQIDFGILAWWPYIIPPEVIGLTKRGFVNTHPGFLPYTRGKHGSFWSIVEGSPFGVTLHYVNEDIDSGPIIAQKEIPVTWLDTGETLYKQAREEILKLFYLNYEAIRDGVINPYPQSSGSGTFHMGKELEAACVIDIDKEYTARTLLNIVRAKMFKGKGTAYFIDGASKYNVTICIEEATE